MLLHKKYNDHKCIYSVISFKLTILIDFTIYINNFRRKKKNFSICETHLMESIWDPFFSMYKYANT